MVNFHFRHKKKTHTHFNMARHRKFSAFMLHTLKEPDVSSPSFEDILGKHSPQFPQLAAPCAAMHLGNHKNSRLPSVPKDTSPIPSPPHTKIKNVSTKQLDRQANPEQRQHVISHRLPNSSNDVQSIGFLFHRELHL